MQRHTQDRGTVLLIFLTFLLNSYVLSGKKSDDPLSPDFVPSVFAHVSSPVKRAATKKMDSFQRRSVLKRKKLEEV